MEAEELPSRPEDGAQGEELGVPASLPTPFSALKNRNFRLFFVGNLLSQSGTYLQNATQSVLIHDLTGSNTAVGLTNAVTFFPVLVLALVGGELADRFNRRRLFIATQVVSLAVVMLLAVLTGAGLVSVGWIYATAAVLGLAYAVAIPTMHSLIPSLVSERELGPAVGLTAVTFNLARVLGPALAAIALATVGFAWAFGINGVSFVALILALLWIRITPRPRDREHASLREGLRFARGDRDIRGMLLALAALSFAVDPVNTLTPSFAIDVFHRTGAAAPLLITAFGAGNIVSAAGLGRLFRDPRANMRLGAITLLMLGGGMAAFALSPNYWVSLVALAAAGAGSLASVTLFTTGLQQRSPDIYRGRVMALWTVAALGTRFPAAIIDGVLGDTIGPRAAALVLLVPLVLAVFLLIPRLSPRITTAQGTARQAPGGQ